MPVIDIILTGKFISEVKDFFGKSVGKPGVSLGDIFARGFVGFTPGDIFGYFIIVKIQLQEPPFFTHAFTQGEQARV